ncbi:MAG: patatin-like phospholipase family protein [Verrucomicrobiota bacterium]
MNARIDNLYFEAGGPTRIPAAASVTGVSDPAPLKIGSIATLAFLSSRLSTERIASNIAESLHWETAGAVLLLHLSSSASALPLANWPGIAPTLNGVFGFAGQTTQDPRGFDRLDLSLGSNPDEHVFLEPLLDHVRRHYRHVLLWVGVGAARKVQIASLSHGNPSFVLFRNDPNNLGNLRLLQAELGAHSKVARRVRYVLCLEEQEHAHELERALLVPALATGLEYNARPAISPDNFRFLRCADGAFESHTRSLAREVAQRRVGLALSSGGAKGLAHIGVIQVLEEHGIDVDVVTGCSMGSYVASIWAHGHDGTVLEKLAREVKGRWGLWKLIDPVLPPRQGFVHGNAVIARLKRTIGEAHFTDLFRPLRVVATNLETLEREVFAGGEVAQAVHASSAIPGVCVPVRIGCETYIDGGIADPLPVDILEEMGVERIIAVNTIPTPAHMRHNRELMRARDRMEARGLGLGAFLNERVNYFARGNILDNLLRSVHGAQMRVAEQASRHAHVVLRPLAIDPHWHEFSKPDKYISLGRRAAEEHLDEILELMNRKETSHDHAMAQEKMAIVA